MYLFDREEERRMMIFFGIINEMKCTKNDLF